MLTVEQINTWSLGELYEFAANLKGGDLVQAALERAYNIGHADGQDAGRPVGQDAPAARANEGDVE